MKLIIAVINKEDASGLAEGLSKNNFSATKIEALGGFLGKQSNIFLIGTEKEKVEKVIGIIKECCKTREENVSPAPHIMEPGELVIPEAERIVTSGAIVFILDAEITKL